MSEKYKIRDPDAMYFVTMTVVGWVDLFTRPELAHVIINSLRHCQREKGLIIHSWCIMPSHLHMIISSTSDLSAVLRDFKKFTSKELVKTIQNIHESRRGWILDLFSEVADGLNRTRYYKVWQDGNHPIQLLNLAMTKQKMDYIHNNPVAAEIVDEPGEYLFSSARDYYTKKKGYLQLVLIE
ncbi:MAG TPA: transposase [Cyclobacteriaceae bacterium]